jgi:MFS family permease
MVEPRDDIPIRSAAPLSSDIDGTASSSSPHVHAKVGAFHPYLVTIYVLGLLQILPSALSVIASIVLVQEVVSGVDYPTSQSVFVISTAFVINSATRVVVSKSFGSLSDYLGRKPLLVWSCLLWVISRIFLVSATTDFMFYQSAFLYGLDVYGAVGQAWIGDLVHDEERGKAYGLLAGLSFGLGFVIGLPLGGWISQTQGPKMALYVGLCMQLMVGVVVTLVPIPDTLGVKSIPSASSNVEEEEGSGAAIGMDTINDDSKMPAVTADTGLMMSAGRRRLPDNICQFLYDNSLIPVLNLWDEKNIIVTATDNPWDFLSFFWAQASQQSLQNVFLLFVQSAYDLTPAESGASLAFVAITVGVFSPIQLNYYQERGVIFWAMVIQLIASVLFCVSGLPPSSIGKSNLVIGIFGMFLISFGGTWVPAFPSTITKQYDVTKKGEVLGTLSLISEMGNGMAYPVGLLLSYALSDKPSIRWPGCVWLVSGSFLVVAIVTQYVTMGAESTTLVRIKNSNSNSNSNSMNDKGSDSSDSDTKGEEERARRSVVPPYDIEGRASSRTLPTESNPMVNVGVSEGMITL